MKAPALAYARAASADEAVAALAEHGEDAKVLAGGQSLGPLLNLRLASPAVLVDVAHASDLRDSAETDGGVRYGATVRHSAIEDGRVPDRCRGLLAAVASGIGYRAVRNRGTLGGSLAHADASAEWPVVMAALDATVHARSAAGGRALPARGFVTGYFTSALADDELLVGVDVPAVAPHTTWGLHKACRKPGEFSESFAVALLHWADGRADADAGADTVATADVWLGAAGDTPLRLTGVEALLAGASAADLPAEAVADATTAQLGRPAGDDERYRAHLHGVTAARAVAAAVRQRSGDPAR